MHSTSAMRGLVLLFLASLSACDCGGGDAIGTFVPLIAVNGRVVFGRTEVGRAVERGLAVKNAGQAPLTVGAVRITAGAELGYAIAPELDVPLVIEPSETRVIILRLEAIASGPADGALVIESDDPARPSVSVLSLIHI